MKPRHLDDTETEPEADAAHSGMRPKRHRVDPRLEEIAEAARAGRLSREEALTQIEQVLLESLGGELSSEARIGAAAALRELRNDPRIIALLPPDDE